MKCVVCSKEWPDGHLKKIELTDSEKEHIRGLGQTDVPDTYHYCPPCWRVLSDRSLGAQYIKGVVQGQLRSMGVAYADERAQVMMEKLLALTKRN